MNKKSQRVIVSVLAFAFLLSACAPGQLLGPTITPTPTATNTPSPTPTNTPTLTPTSTPTLTPTPVPVCNPDATVLGNVNEDFPGYLDILDVTSTLSGKRLTVVFTMREIPDEITINREALGKGYPEIAWGVAIDADNDPDTGGQGFLTRSGYGYEYVLQAFNFKNGAERSGSIESLLRYHNTYLWKIKDDGGISSGANGTLRVDQEAKTITLGADIQGISPDSYLHFFTFYNGEADILVDEICER